MSKVGRWSTAAGSNNAAVPDGWPEGQLPSSVNDCAREMMSSIRTAFSDLGYVDHDFTPTFLTATSFSVPGNQTSAIQIGRRLKCYDATAGVGQIIYATVSSVSFTAVTTIHITPDSASLTSSLSSFGISIISNDNSPLPRNLALTVSSVTVLGNMSISGSIAGASLVVSGTAAASTFIGGTLSLSATAVAPNIAKAFISTGFTSAGGINIQHSFNISSISRSAAGVVRITFSNAFTTLSRVAVISLMGIGGVAGVSSPSNTATTCKFTTLLASTNSAVDGVSIQAAWYRA